MVTQSETTYAANTIDLVSAKDIEKAIMDEIDALLSMKDKTTPSVTLQDVLSSDVLIDAYNDYGDVIFGGGNQYPTKPQTPLAIAQFLIQYLQMFSISTLEKIYDKKTAIELYEFYMRKITSAIYSLFATVEELGMNFGGFSPKSNDIAVAPMLPVFSLIGNSTNISAPILPSGVSISAVALNNKLKFAQKIEVSGTVDASSSVQVSLGWVKNYASFDTSMNNSDLSNMLGVKLPLAVSLEDNATMLILGVWDKTGVIKGTYYTDANDKSLEKRYVLPYSAQLGGETPSHVIDNGSSMFLGKDIQGYLNVNVNSELTLTNDATTAAAVTASTTLDVEILGLVFMSTPALTNLPY